MITNFEKETADLTPEEQRILSIIVKRFKDKPGKTNEVTNRQIVSALSEKLGIKTTEVRIRKIINFIRVRSLLPGLVATSTGYYLTRNPEDLKRYIQSLKDREEAIRAVRLAAESDLNILSSIHKQETLFKS